MKIAIIGTGGVAEAFAMALTSAEGSDAAERLHVTVVGRNAERLEQIACAAHTARCETDILEQEGEKSLVEADIYILAVSDKAVAELAQRLPFRAGSTLVHTAGSVEMERLRCENTVQRGVDIGVIYPLQSFTPGRRVEMAEVPIFVEMAEGENSAIMAVAGKLSERVLEMSSQERIKMHLGAVFASNFVNMMFSATELIIAPGEEQEATQAAVTAAIAPLQMDIYKPLIEQTLAKAFEMHSPRLAQTGPAKRNDMLTMERHIEVLESESRTKILTETYKNISELIWETSKRI